MTTIFSANLRRTSLLAVAVVIGLGGCTNQVQDTGNTAVPASTTTTTSTVCCSPAPGGSAANSGSYDVSTQTSTTTTGASANTAVNTTYTAPAATTYSAHAAAAPQVSAPDGRPSVQVLAAGEYGTAQQMLQRIQSSGYSAVIVQVGGLYKVRVPYNSYEEAKANLGAIRSIAPDAFVSMQ